MMAMCVDVGRVEKKVESFGFERARYMCIVVCNDGVRA